MDNQSNKYQHHRAATRFKNKLHKKSMGTATKRTAKLGFSKTELRTIRQPGEGDNVWPVLTILAITSVLILIGLILFIGGNIWELYPLLHRIELPVFLNAAVIISSTALALAVLFLRPKLQLPIAILTCTILLSLFAFWPHSQTESSRAKILYTAQPDASKHTPEIKTKHRVKSKFAPHIRRRLCLDDGTDIDRIECQNQSSKKRNYTWATL